MNPKHKKYWITGLVSLLAAWLFLEYRMMNAEQDRFQRRMLRISRVEESAPNTPPHRAAPHIHDAVDASVTPLLPVLSACLATPDASHAPVTISVAPSTPDAPPIWSISPPSVPAEAASCLRAALAALGSLPPTHETILISLAPLATPLP